MLCNWIKIVYLAKAVCGFGQAYLFSKQKKKAWKGGVGATFNKVREFILINTAFT